MPFPNRLLTIGFETPLSCAISKGGKLLFLMVGLVPKIS